MSYCRFDVFCKRRDAGREVRKDRVLRAGLSESGAYALVMCDSLGDERIDEDR